MAAVPWQGFGGLAFPLTTAAGTALDPQLASTGGLSRLPELTSQ